MVLRAKEKKLQTELLALENKGLEGLCSNSPIDVRMVYVFSGFNKFYSKWLVL